MPNYHSGEKNCYYFLNRLLSRTDEELHQMWKKLRGIHKKSQSQISKKKISSKHWKTAIKNTLSKGSDIGDIEMKTINKLIEITENPESFLIDSKGEPVIRFRSKVSSNEFISKCIKTIHPFLVQMKVDLIPKIDSIIPEPLENFAVKESPTEISNLSTEIKIDQEKIYYKNQVQMDDEYLFRIKAVEIEQNQYTMMEIENLRRENLKMSQRLIDAENEIVELRRANARLGRYSRHSFPEGPEKYEIEEAYLTFD